jgi:acetyl esterase/lipase
MSNSEVYYQVMPRIARMLLRRTVGTACAVAFLVLMSSCSGAQVIDLYPGKPPGTENWPQKEKTIENTPVGTVIFNVSTPTLTAYLPEKTKATGTGVIIAPGGAFVALAISLEGDDLAHWLQSKGIAAFVLKYRIPEKQGEGIPANLDMDQAGQYGMADGIEAVKLLRQRASEFGLKPDRIGIIGFSAGAMVASATVLQPDADARPNFAAFIYGGPFGKMPTIPAKLPPMFMAWALDDTVALKPIERFHDALIAAGAKPEVHVFSAGGHGFGLKKQNTTSDHWIDLFGYWLDAQGLLR